MVTAIDNPWQVATLDNAGRKEYRINYTRWVDSGHPHPVTGKPIPEAQVIVFLLGLKQSRVNGKTLNWHGYIYSGEKVKITNM